MNKLLLLLATLCTVACTKLESSKPVNPVDAAFFTVGEGARIPSTDVVSLLCFDKSEFDACIYLKNPVAQENAPLSANAYNEKRKFGVKVRGLSPTGYLENPRIAVYSLNSERFTLAHRGQLKSGSFPSGTFLEQFSAYYWSNRVFEHLEARLGAERVNAPQIKIYADDGFSGYVSSQNSVHLERKQGQIAKALNGEVVIHLVAQAIANSLSQRELFKKDLTQHNTCALDPKGCCTTNLGCAQALGNSFGEYVAAIMFPDSAKIGESLANNLTGQKICDVARSLDTLSAKTRAEIFSACAPQGRAVLMGAWYASQWWKLRAQAEAQETGASQDIDKLFFDHAKVFKSTSTFADAKAEALRLATDYKGGKFLAAFTTALSGI